MTPINIDYDKYHCNYVQLHLHKTFKCTFNLWRRRKMVSHFHNFPLVLFSSWQNDRVGVCSPLISQPKARSRFSNNFNVWSVSGLGVWCGSGSTLRPGWVCSGAGLGLLWGRVGSGSQLGGAADRDGFHGVLTCLEKPGFRHVNSPRGHTQINDDVLLCSQLERQALGDSSRRVMDGYLETRQHNIIGYPQHNYRASTDERTCAQIKLRLNEASFL